tara:strand:- start:505 stop:1284 length:780 start_codon:yes stop_codon:yes gene_type:complete
VLPKFLKPYQINNSNLIRIGPKRDGGYVIDKRIIKKTYNLVTCGLNDDWEFEKEFLKKNINCNLYAYDHTINNRFWIKRFKKDIIHLLLFKKLRWWKILDIFKYINYLNFFRKNKIHLQKKIVSKKKKKNQITISKILNNLKNIFLKIDIEGDEYQILNDVKNNSKNLVFLIIEFHEVHKNLKKIEKFLKRLDLKLIHIHANNFDGTNRHNIPKVLELSLLNKRFFLIKNKLTNNRYPIKYLDYKNFKRRNEIKIEFNK